MFSNRLGVQNAYSHRTKVGNWSEEMHAQELMIKEHVSKSEVGSLKVTTLQNHLNSSLSPAPLTFSADGKIRFGDSVMFYSVQTEGVLSVDTSDKIAAADEAFAVTTSTLTQAHVARNTFTIEPYEARDRYGDVLKYAQPFRIRINDKLTPQPCFMRSEPVSASSFSRISRKQLVSFCTFPIKSGAASAATATTAATAAATAASPTRAGVTSPTQMILKAGKLVPKSSVATSGLASSGGGGGSVGASGVAYPPSPFDTVWKCVYKDISKRFENEGQPVQANAEMLLEHAHTKHGLGSDSALKYYNDFGVEFEVCAHTHLNTSKKQNLYSELRGMTTVHTPVRHEHTQNTWAILTASQPDDAQPTQQDVKSAVKSSVSPTSAKAAVALTAAAAAAKPPTLKQQPTVVASPKGPRNGAGQSSGGAPPAKQKEPEKTADDQSGGEPEGVTLLRKVLVPRGAAALHALSRFCRVLDSSRSGSISAEDLSNGLDQLCGDELALSQDQWNEMCGAIATGHDTQVSYGHLLEFLRSQSGGVLPGPGLVEGGRRLRIVEKSFQKLDKLRRGLIRLDDLANGYDASADPSVKQKLKTPMQVVSLVTSAFDGYGGDNTLTFDDFADYYATVSVFVPNDDFFVKMITGAYKVAE